MGSAVARAELRANPAKREGKCIAEGSLTKEWEEKSRERISKHL
jgi:hypothetical protein